MVLRKLLMISTKYSESVLILRSTKLISKKISNGRGKPIKKLFPWVRQTLPFLPGDDYWTDPYKLQKQVDYLESNLKYAYCFHPVKILNEKTKILVSSDYGAPRKDKEYNLNDLLENCNFVPTSSLLFRTNLIKDLPKSFHKYPFGDWPLQMIVLSECR